MPVFTDDNKSDEAEQEEKGSNAFRYLMVMGAIVMQGFLSHTSQIQQFR